MVACCRITQDVDRTSFQHKEHKHEAAASLSLVSRLPFTFTRQLDS